MKNTNKILLLRCFIFTLFAIFNFNIFSQTPQLTLQTGHSDEIHALAFSEDGKYLASAGKDNVIIIWDFLLGKEIRRLAGHSGQVNDLLFLDPEHLISAGADSKIIFWNLANGNIEKTIVNNKPVSSLNINFDRSLLAVAGTPFFSICNLKDSTIAPEYIFTGICSNVKFKKGENIIFYSSRTKKEKGIYRFNIDKKTSEKILNKMAGLVDFSDSENQLIYTSYKKSTINYLDYVSGKLKFTRPGEYSKYKFSCMALSMNDSTLAAGNFDNSIYIFDNKNHKRKEIIRKLPAPALSILFYPVNNDIIVFSVDREVYVWNIRKNKLLRKLTSTVFPISSVDINKDGKLISFSGLNNIVKVFDLTSSLKLKTLNTHDANITGLSFISTDTIASVGLDNKLSYCFEKDSSKAKDYKVNKSSMLVLDKTISAAIPLSVGGNLLTMFYLGKSFFIRKHETLNAISVSGNKRWLATGGGGWRGVLSLLFFSRNFPIYIYNNDNLKKDYTLYGHFEPIRSLAFNHNNHYLASAASSDIYLKIWDLETRKLKDIFYSKDYIDALAFNNINDSLIFSSTLQNIYLFNLQSDTADYLTSGKKPLYFNKDGKNIFYQDSKYNMVEFNLLNKEPIKTFSGHNDLITSASLSEDGSRMVTASWDGTVKIWNTSDGKEIATLIAISESDFIVKTPDNYYYSTKKAKEEIGFSTGVKFYPFEQFDLKNNRPDIILERIGFADSSLINAYKRAYYKRLKKMNFDESMFNPDFHIPEIEILNQKNEFATNNNIFDLNIIANDNKYNLDRINVWINNVPVFGSQGINLRNEHSGKINKTIPIELIPGKNTIQVSCLNDKGVESLKETKEIAYTKKDIKSDLYIVTIGTSEYKDSRFNLSYAAKDATDMADLFKNNNNIYSNVFTKTLVNEEVTKENIINLKQFISKAGINDIVLVFVSGHGILDSNFDYYFGTNDIDFNNPSLRGLEYAEIEELLDGIKAIKKLLFMDTCHSGELEKEDLEIAQNINTEYGEVKFRSAGVNVKNKSGLGLNNTTEIMKDLFTDLRTGTGSTVISSSSGVEYAMESEKWKNGLFTFCIINGLTSKKADLNKDGEIMLSELQEYVRNNVSKLSGGKQVPTNRIENLSMNFRIW